MTIESSITKCQKKVFPDFLEFSFDPKEGYQVHGLNFWTYCKWGCKDDMLKSFAFPTFLYATATASLGGSIGFIQSALQQEKFNFRTAVEDAMKWVIPSAIVGIGLGAYRYKTYSLKNHVVMHATNETYPKAKTIVETFLESQLGKDEEISDIFCPITLQVMAYPVKTKCTSKGHTFEYYSMLRLFEDQSHAPCPLCRKQVKLEDLSHDQELESRIEEIVKQFFIKLEVLLQTLPRDLDDELIPDFSDSSAITYLYEKTQKGQKFLDGDLPTIVEKIHHPEQLSKEEIFALSYFFINQVCLIKDKIDNIHQIAGSFLIQLRAQGNIDHRTFTSQMSQLSSWYEFFGIIPEECKIISKVYLVSKKNKTEQNSMAISFS
ncbi:MAG: NSE2 family E3 SUMO-protein ligase [Candidatus Rhabdochlamydia sp.]